MQLDPGRGFWVNLSVALGFTGLSLMGLQFVLAARWPRVEAPFGVDVLLQFHRQVSWLVVVLLLAHPAILMVWDSRYLALLDLPDAPFRAQAAVLSTALLLVLVATAVWRRRFRLSYAVWQALHAVLAVAIVVLALLHVLGIGYYVDQPWERALWIAYSGAFVWLSVWVRVVKPLQRRERRWVVVSVEPQPGRSTTLTPRPRDPAAYGPDGFRFTPGQFAWIHIGRSPFALTYHPFSFSSSAEDTGEVSFTIKALGPFSSDIAQLRPGQTVYLEGPCGHFSVDRHDGPGFVFIAAGVGVTPLLSMLETLADRGDRRPCWLFLGNREPDQVTCAAELEALRPRLDLRLVHVISGEAPGWTGERGRVDRALLDRLLPPDRAELQYFICASEAMMDSVEHALEDLGVPDAHVHSERFAMV